MISTCDADIIIVKHHDLQEKLSGKNLNYTYFDITGDGACIFTALSQTF